DASVETAVREVLRLEGRIDLLVNNAGFSVAPAGAEESSTRQAQSIFDTNFFGIVRMTRAVVPHMRQQGGGRIINIGSVLGFLPMPYGALYAATKHAVEGYSESLDHELRTRGIRVSVIEPAYTKTPFDANFLKPDATLEEYREVRAAVNKRVRELMATADEPRVVADVVLRAATAARPKVRYTAGGLGARLRFLRTFLPAGVMDTGIRRDLRLDARHRRGDGERRCRLHPGAGIREGRPARILARRYGRSGHREAGATPRAQDDPRRHRPCRGYRHRQGHPDHVPGHAQGISDLQGPEALPLLHHDGEWPAGGWQVPQPAEGTVRDSRQ